ncbi:MAG: class A beta-lactamase-related serine hydrolase [Gemmatimonadota bacterium]|nr:class A beta-lactamase-related serine hydrolase [Gemmatimonadota bacterium]
MQASTLARIALPAFLVASPVAAQGTMRNPARDAHADTASLHRTLDSLAGAHHGTVGYSVIDLDDGDRLSLRGDETFPTASLIKVGILVMLYDQVAKGRISLDDPVTVLRIDQVPGSGIVQFLHNGTTLSIRDAAWLMTILSDNTATNLILDRIGIRPMWDKMESLGLHHTKVHAKVFKQYTSVAMDSSVKYGLGVTTPNEIAHLFELLAAGKAVSASADSTMLDILEHNEDQQLMQRYLDGVRAAHKTGADDSVRTECSLFYLRHRVVACVLTKDNKDTRWVLDSEPQITMGRMGYALFQAWGPALPAAVPGH